jgi:hypothetical protein
LRSKIGIKSKAIDNMGREVVDLEVRLAKVVSKRKEVGLENDSISSKLDKLADLSDGKIHEMTTKLIRTDDETF